MDSYNLQGKSGANNMNGQKNDKNKSKRGLCYRFNMGKCTFGFNCNFDHRCAFCSKFGHGSHNCRRAQKGETQVEQPNRELLQIEQQPNTNPARLPKPKS